MPLREFSNLAWPETPYAADTRPFARNVRLLTGMSIQWADDGTRGIPISAAAVFLPVHRTAARQITPGTLHFGYRAAALEPDGGPADLLTFVDSILVQGRRQGEIIAWHSFADDLHALRPLLTAPRAGIDSVGGAWADRSTRERGTALPIDTAGTEGVQLGGALTEAGLGFGPVLWNLRAPELLQQLYEDLNTPTASPECVVRHLQHAGGAALMCALAVALLAGQQAGRLTWQDTLDLEEPLSKVAWDTLPRLFDVRNRQVI